MTTVHAYTNDQNLLDLPHKDLRRARAGRHRTSCPPRPARPRATGLVLPAMKGRLDGHVAPRPAPRRLDHRLHRASSRAALRGRGQRGLRRSGGQAAAGAGPRLHRDPSSRATSWACPPRAFSTPASPWSMPINDELSLVKVFGWYDNEWGYSNRLVDLDRAGRRPLIGWTPLRRAAAARGSPRRRRERRVLVRVDFNVPLAHRHRRQGHGGRRLPDRGRAAHAALAAGRRAPKWWRARTWAARRDAP